jgi:hypothetical protein
LAGAFFAVAISDFSIKDVVDAPGVGESRMSPHFSSVTLRREWYCAKLAAQSSFPSENTYSHHEVDGLSQWGITVRAL